MQVSVLRFGGVGAPDLYIYIYISIADGSLRK